MEMYRAICQSLTSRSAGSRKAVGCNSGSLRLAARTIGFFAATAWSPSVGTLAEWVQNQSQNPALRTFVENTPWRNTLQGAVLGSMEIREAFAQNLRALRRARGLSQEELAHQAGIDRTYISALERNVYNPSIDVVDRLAEVLGVDVAELLKRPSADPQRSKSELDE